MDPATPPVNLYEGNGQLSVVTPVPGAQPQHTEVIVTPTTVEIAARCKYPQARQHYHQHEWQVGSWALSVELPRPVDPTAARATLNLGVLVVMAPVVDEATTTANGHSPRVVLEALDEGI